MSELPDILMDHAQLTLAQAWYSDSGYTSLKVNEDITDISLFGSDAAFLKDALNQGFALHFIIGDFTMGTPEIVRLISLDPNDNTLFSVQGEGTGNTWQAGTPLRMGLTKESLKNIRSGMVSGVFFNGVLQPPGGFEYLYSAGDRQTVQRPDGTLDTFVYSGTTFLQTGTSPRFASVNGLWQDADQHWEVSKATVEHDELPINTTIHGAHSWYSPTSLNQTGTAINANSGLVIPTEHFSYSVRMSFALDNAMPGDFFVVKTFFGDYSYPVIETNPSFKLPPIIANAYYDSALPAVMDIQLIRPGGNTTTQFTCQFVQVNLVTHDGLVPYQG